MFRLQKLKILFCVQMFLAILTSKNVRAFYKKEFQNKNKKEFRMEKVIRRKGDKLYVRWKDYGNSFDS